MQSSYDYADTNNTKLEKQKYRKLLQEQIQQKEQQQHQEKYGNLKEVQQLQNEAEKYNYFGRPGGGAPRRDRNGRIITIRNIEEMIENAGEGIPDEIARKVYILYNTLHLEQNY